MSNERSAGWKLVSLDEAGVKHGSGVWGADPSTQGKKLKIIRNGDIDKSGRILQDRTPTRTVSDRELEKATVRPGDVLVTTSGDVGKCALWTGPEGSFGVSNFVRRLRPEEPWLGPYLTYYLRTNDVRALFERNSRGSTIRNLAGAFWDELRLPLPPRQEAEAITAALDSYFSRLDEVEAGLERVQRNLKRYRASVLQAAVTGRLVPTEAELARAEGRECEPASELLKRILVERRKKWEESGRRGKYVEPAPPDTSSLSGLPEGWCWATAEQLTLFITDGEHQTPPRSNAGVYLLSARNVQNGWISLDDVDYISKATHESLARRLTVKQGDVLLSCSGTVGRSCVVPEGLEFSLVRSAAVLRPCLAQPEYLSLALRSPLLQHQIARSKTQTAQSNIFQGSIKRLALPLPPASEQERIVRSAVAALGVIDHEGRSIEEAQRRTMRLRQSILKAAFDGALLDENLNSEEAELFLERRREERDSPQGKAKPSHRERGNR